MANKLAKKLKKARFEKLGLGALMRIVRSKHYENLTDDLTEVHLLRKKVPGMKRYIGILEKKRDQSRKKRNISPFYDTPAFKLAVSAQRSK